MRLIHTADWQLGLQLNFVEGDNAARLRAQRLEAVRRIAEVARQNEVDAVAVAGDVFDGNAVGPETLQQARDALATFAPIPVLLLPGNHDPADPHSALGRLGAGDHVRVLATADPVEIPGGVVHPCPLTKRHESGDPTAHLTPCPDDGRVHVVLAHGGVLEFSETTETPNKIDAQRVIELGYDYLALGDWHSVFSLDGQRIWYSGTPEATRWKERDPGKVLLVSVPSHGAIPEVNPVHVARSRWVEETFRLESDEDVGVFRAWLEALPEKSWTLVRLHLQGQLSLHARAELDSILDEAAGQLLCLDVVADEIVDAASEEELAALQMEGFVGEAVAELRADASPLWKDALRVLYGIHRSREGAA